MMDEMEREIKKNIAYIEMLDEFSKCTDMQILENFDIDSEKMVFTKLRVLKALNNGKTENEIGEDYYKIQERRQTQNEK